MKEQTKPITRPLLGNNGQPASGPQQQLQPHQRQIAAAMQTSYSDIREQKWRNSGQFPSSITAPSNADSLPSPSPPAPSPQVQLLQNSINFSNSPAFQHPSQHSSAASTPNANTTYSNGQFAHPAPPSRPAKHRSSTKDSDSETIYSSVTKPFSYVPGYHALFTYLKSRFVRSDLVRIAAAMSRYRPSFIALTKTLKEEDLLFMEKCLQRTMLEYEKFIQSSGTPTVVWRRTGQITLVGKEFCLLTQWTREQLLGKRTFIVELMDDASVVEYFERFSSHAFGDSSSVMTTCVIKSQSNRHVPCAFCFTIKRDMFDIPMLIVGNVRLSMSPANGLILILVSPYSTIKSVFAQ